MKFLETHVAHKMVLELSLMLATMGGRQMSCHHSCALSALRLNDHPSLLLSLLISMIRHKKINALFPNAQIIQGDAFGSVGLGLTINAHRRYG